MKIEKHWRSNMWTCNDPSIVISEKRISETHGSYILIADMYEPENVNFDDDSRRRRVCENGVIVKWSEGNQYTG